MRSAALLLTNWSEAAAGKCALGPKLSSGTLTGRNSLASSSLRAKKSFSAVTGTISLRFCRSVSNHSSIPVTLDDAFDGDGSSTSDRSI